MLLSLVIASLRHTPLLLYPPTRFCVTTALGGRWQASMFTPIPTHSFLCGNCVGRNRFITLHHPLVFVWQLLKGLNTLYPIIKIPLPCHHPLVFVWQLLHRRLDMVDTIPSPSNSTINTDSRTSNLYVLI